MLRRLLTRPIILLCFAAAPATAQSFQGRVIDADSGSPVPGAIVKTIGPSGQVGVGTLTDDTGRFNLIPPPGIEVTQIVLERIGFTTNRFDPGRFSAGPVELSIDFEAIELPGIVVTAESLCRVGNTNSSSVQALWDEARKSLEATALSQTGRQVRYESEVFTRRLDPSGETVIDGNVEFVEYNADLPFRAITVERMTEQGWVDYRSDGGIDLYAPDAGVLLTDEFAAQHCFSGEVTPEAILLKFTPNVERRDIPELEGTLVLDPQTAELTELRYTYVGLPASRSQGAGGDIHFFAAPNGLRIVQNWAIRAPAVRIVRRGSGSLANENYQIEWIQEQGGRVVAIETGGQTINLPAESLGLEPRSRTDALAGVEGDLVAANRTIGAGLELMLRNNTQGYYQVTRLNFRNCVNTAVPCGSYDVDVVAEPGETATLFRMRRRQPVEEFSFDWDYEGSFMSGDLQGSAPASVEAVPYNADVIVESQIPENRYRSALDLVRTERPNWLRVGGRQTFGRSTDNGVVLYMDGIRYGPVEMLSTINIDLIQQIEFVDAPTATMRWGTGHPYGVVLITSKGH